MFKIKVSIVLNYELYLKFNFYCNEILQKMATSSATTPTVTPSTSSSSNNNENLSAANMRKKILCAAVGALLQESGFQTVEKPALGTLTEILQSSMYYFRQLYKN